MALLKLEGIRKNYHRGRIVVPVLKGVSLTVERGEMVALMGASGSGKTTLINLMGSLDRPTSGRYWLDGEDVSELDVVDRALLRGRKIGFVFQNFNLLPRLTALENVMMPLIYSTGGLPEREGRGRAVALLQRVGLGDRLDHEPSQLSGGEQQRVAIARALANRCSLLIADEPTGNLDSKTGEEILGLFRQLNVEDGLTIVMVTHDENVAGHADRIIRIRDGVICSSSEPAPARPAPVSRVASATPYMTSAEGKPAGPSWADEPPPRPKGASGGRFVIRTAGTALRSLRRNVLRSALTTLGIIIGVASLIAIAEIGKGAWTAIREMLTKTGVDNILVQAGAASRNGVSLGSGSVKTLTPEDAEAILRECPSVESLAPIVSARRQVLHGGKNWVPSSLLGTTPGFLQVRDWDELDEGETFTAEDVRDSAMVCVLGRTLVQELFEDESPIGQEVYVGDVPLKVIGVLRPKGADVIGEDQDDILLAPWTTIKFRVSASSESESPRAAQAIEAAAHADPQNRRYARTRSQLYPTASATQVADSPRLERMSNVDMILVRSRSTDEIPAAMEQVSTLLRERHRIGPDDVDDFAVRDFTEVVNQVRSTVSLVAGLLLCVALISLVVGGVGIMNIMLVSVTERYREIGLRMAVGARPADILRQFLVEAVVLCLLGGAAGILTGRGSSILVKILAGWPTSPSLLAILASVSASITVGVIFGYYPAWKASRLDPIVALRFE